VGVAEDPLAIHLHERPVRCTDHRPQLVVPQADGGQLPKSQDAAEDDQRAEHRDERRLERHLQTLDATAEPVVLEVRSRQAHQEDYAPVPG
jgi:hypothetical protein